MVTAAAAISAFQRANSFITRSNNTGNDEVTFKVSTDGRKTFGEKISCQASNRTVE
ncbi:MAG: hypothetical protein ACJ71M_00755 [Nitrososphaeraceae archaeon]